jgi:hypothetical protein
LLKFNYKIIILFKNHVKITILVKRLFLKEEEEGVQSMA